MRSNVVGPLRVELARKAIHVASSAIPVSYALGITRGALLVLLAALGVIAVVVEVARFRSARARALFVGAVGPLLRAHEHHRWSGATWLLAAYVLAVVLFPRDVAVAAMLAAGLGDASAAIVGRSVSVARAARGHAVASTQHKTLAGSIACAIVTFACALLIASLPPHVALVMALAASIAERWNVPSGAISLDDNVRVALAAGVVAMIAMIAMRAM